MFRFLTAGESHGPQLTAIVEGVPAGLPLPREAIDADLRRRQGGYGRGARMRIEHDQVQLCSGVRFGMTLGSPIALVIENRDWVNWRERMAVDAPAPDADPVALTTRLRPGHADLTGALKFGHDDVRNVIERASSRETAARVAVGGVARQLLAQFGIAVHSHVTAIGGALAPEYGELTPDFWERVEASPVRCADAAASAAMMAAIDAARSAGDTAGGVVEVVATGVPIGLGSYSQWDQRLGARLGQALLSIPSSKGCEIGGGFALAGQPGSRVHDVIRRGPAGFTRQSNNAGGMEGGISDGQPIVARVAFKPIPTLPRPLPSVNLATGAEEQAPYERSDFCIVPAGGVVAEAMLCIVLAGAFLEKFGGDHLREVRRNYDGYVQELSRRMGVSESVSQ